MKIIIHGTSGGYRNFTPDTEILIDARPDFNDVASIGQEAFAINFRKAHVVFSKYKIIRDVIGSRRTGHVAFSLLVPHSNKLAGSDIVILLNEISNYFCERFISNNNLEYFSENNWEWMYNILRHFEKNLQENNDCFFSEDDFGINVAAYLYYPNLKSLENYFNDPYHSAYFPFKQIFLVEDHFEDKPGNPLNALKHDPRANLTREIDLENYESTLYYNSNAAGGQIKVFFKKEILANKSKIRKNDKLEIVWSKPFCNEERIEGTWAEIGDDCFHINEMKKTLTVKEKQLKPSFRPFKINLEFNADPPDSPPTLFLKFKDSSLISESFEETKKFKEEDINKGFYLSAACADLTSNQVFIGPNFRATEVVLTLNKRKGVRFVVLNERRKELHDFELKIIQKEGAIKNGFVDFLGDEIKMVWKVQVSHKDYETHSLEVKPDEKEAYEIKLTPKAKPRKREYYLQVNKIKGRQPRDRNGEKRTITNKSPENILECQPNFGFKFIGWQGPELDADYDGRYVAVFEQLWYLKVLKVSIVVLPIFLASIIYILNTAPPPPSVDPTTEIMSYVEGVELNADSLEQLKQSYCNGSSVPKPKSDDTPWWNLFSIFATGDDENHAGNSLDLNACCQKINEALDFRIAINLGEIDELKSQAFLAEQQEFKAAIDSIEEKYKKQIGDTLNKLKVSAMDLNQIATLILEKQRTLRAQEAVEIPVQVDSIAKAPGTVRGNPNPSSSPPASSLEQSFFKLVNSGNAEKGEYDKLKTKYKGTGGPIMDYLNKICKNGSTFEKFAEISVLDRKKAKSVEDIKIND
jgi:hypothetical protein